jgi:predicted Zn finger-like uncharacterized protein
MSMKTTCPKCHTSFRVTTEQLNAHQGDVRCGICAFLFNAFDSLAPARNNAAAQEPRHEPEAAPSEPVAEIEPACTEEEISLETDEALEPVAAPEAIPAPLLAEEAAIDFGAAMEEAPVLSQPPLLLSEAEQEPEEEEISLDFDKALQAVPAPLLEEEASIDFGAAMERITEEQSAPVPTEIRAIEEIYADFAKEEAAPHAVAAQEALAPTSGKAQLEELFDDEIATPQPEEELWKFEAPPKKRFGWLWTLGSLPLLFLLAGQAVYFYRVELAARLPDSRAYLEQACVLLHCSISLPRNADLLKIESSDLEADTEFPSRVTLVSVLSNRASYRQTYPLLELTLTNHADQAVARRVFSPSEYLAAGGDLKRGMPANGEVSVRLNLDLGELNAVGYRLYVYYAAQ